MVFFAAFAVAGTVHLADRPTSSRPAGGLGLAQLLERGRGQFAPLLQHPLLPASLRRGDAEPAEVAPLWLRRLRQRPGQQVFHDAAAPTVVDMGGGGSSHAGTTVEADVRRPFGRRRGDHAVLAHATQAQSLVRELSSTGGGQLIDAKTAKKAKKRVLILISDTGGGHRASAEAMEAAMEQVCSSYFASWMSPRPAATAPTFFCLEGVAWQKNTCPSSTSGRKQ